MAGMMRGLQLEGGVRKAEVLGETGLQSIEDLRGVAGFEAMVLHDDVSSQRGRAGRNRPGMKVVDIQHVGHIDQMGADFAEREVIGSGLQEDLPRITEQAPRCPSHQGDHEERRHRICPVPPGQHDYEPSYRRPDKGVKVGQDVVVRAPYVEAPTVGLGQGLSSEDVDQRTQQGHAEDEAPEDVLGSDQPLKGLDGDQD